jgi:uncharacterized membrane protein (Fun14 family)
MNIWILVAIAGSVFTIAGFIFFVLRYPVQKSMKTSAFFVGIFIPMLAALSYAETLVTDFFPILSLLDLGAFYFIGMISGFFIALFLLKHSFLVKKLKV